MRKLLTVFCMLFVFVGFGQYISESNKVHADLVHHKAHIKWETFLFLEDELFPWIVENYTSDSISVKFVGVFDNNATVTPYTNDITEIVITEFTSYIKMRSKSSKFDLKYVKPLTWSHDRETTADIEIEMYTELIKIQGELFIHFRYVTFTTIDIPSPISHRFLIIDRKIKKSYKRKQ